MLFFAEVSKSIRVFISAAEPTHPPTTNRTTGDPPSTSQCLLFAPAEYFVDTASKLQLARTLSSSFRVNLSTNSSSESSDEQSSQQQSSPTSNQQTTNSSVEMTPPSVYVLCVPISNELESEWRGVTHTISTNKHITSIFPLHFHWKTTTIFLLTHQINNLEMFEELFRDRLSKTNIQQNDLYKFETKSGQTLQKRSCFEKVDRAMNDLAHAILTLSNSIANNVEQFEKLIGNPREPIDPRNYIVRSSSSSRNSILVLLFSIPKNVYLRLQWISFVKQVTMPHN